MKYSVLMSVYAKDNPEHLGIALKSIYDDQTRKPDEIVVVFDGQLTNELYLVLDEFYKGKETVVRYYPQKENKGLGEALKIGGAMCTGDYIFRMDSDDISDSLRFEKQIAYIEQNPEVDVFGTDISEFYYSPLEDNLRVRSCPAHHRDILKLARNRNPFNHMSVCIKRSALQECGGYQPLMLYEDYYLWVRMIANGCTLGNINESLVRVRIGNGFYSRRSSNARIKSCIKLQKYMLEHHINNIFDALFNILCIVVFTYCPAWVKKFVYDKFLRK